MIVVYRFERLRRTLRILHCRRKETEGPNGTRREYDEIIQLFGKLEIFCRDPDWGGLDDEGNKRDKSNKTAKLGIVKHNLLASDTLNHPLPSSASLR